MKTPDDVKEVIMVMLVLTWSKFQTFALCFYADFVQVNV